MLFSIHNYAMHIMHTQINDLIIANWFIFPHTFSLGQEHFSGWNRVSSDKNCRKRQVSTESQWTEKEIKVCM